MATPIILKLDVTKLRKEWFFKGTKGTYCDIVIYENDEVSQFGDSHVGKQSPSKEARENGEKPHIVANGKWMPQKGGRQRAHSTTPQPPKPSSNDNLEDQDCIPF